MHRFTDFTSPQNVFGEDIDPESISKFESFNSKFEKGKQIPSENLKICPAEALDFPDEKFDIVFSNEVLEHVQDDVKSVSEAWRVLKKGGVFVVFTPNSGWPFETHGVFLFGKYFWGNIPLLPWLPKFVQRAFAPHVRNYTNSDISRLFTQDSWEFVERSHVFPGFDGAVRRWGKVGSLIQRFFFAIEKTPMHWFGISHFVVVRKYLNF